jgi:hypothetical protein
MSAVCCIYTRHRQRDLGGPLGVGVVSFIYKLYRVGDRMEPCGTPARISRPSTEYYDISIGMKRPNKLDYGRRKLQF